MRREQSQRMARIHHQCLFFGHSGQILHGQQVLGPVLKYGSVTAIRNQFVRMLCYRRVEVVGDHQHDGCRLFGFVRVFVNRAGIHLIVRTETIHVDTSVGFQLMGKFIGQHLVELFREIPQSIPQCQFFFFRRKNVFSFRSVTYTFIVRFRCR